MKRTLTTLLSLVLAGPVLAQWPEGTPLEERGSYPSPMGNPTPMEKLEVFRTDDGRWVTRDGREVVGFPDDESSIPNRNLHRTDPDNTIDDPPHEWSTPGELE